MTGALILWGHALAALLFGALALAERQRPELGWPRGPFVAALALTALWALSVAGIDARDVSTRLAEGMRNLAWLWFLARLGRQLGGRGGALTLLYLVVAGVCAAAAVMALADDPAVDTATLAALRETRHAFRMMTVAGGLVLLHQLALAARGRGDVRLVVVALGGMWGLDLVIAATGFLQGAWPAPLAAFRGLAMAGVALLIAAAAQRGEDGAPALSRTAAWRTLAAFAVLLYAGATAFAVNLAGTMLGANGRLVQTAIVFGATAALLTLASTPWLRAWARVKVAKHLFSHRYDYRLEWQRFTATLGSPGGEAEPLGIRVVRAVADLTDSPAGILLVADEGVLASAAAWNWPEAPDLAEAGLATYLAASGRIVALGQPCSDEEARSIPAALMADPHAWVMVPLIHGEALAGAIVLARPPVDRALDWEDLDLLRVAGRQAASYLAEHRAHVALAEAARFDEFNRRFAFLLHDIKNVASQLTLVARNAERHADNPAFRADMVATLRDGAERMTALLARLGEHDASRPEPAQLVDLAALARRVAAGRRAQHPVAVEIDGTPLADAQPARLEQVLGHLVQNAVEASGADDPVRIIVRHAGDRVAIDVIDRGAGMTPAFVRDQLFRPFASTKPGGFGIGAYEARQLVRRMGGEIEVDSRVGEGTRFSVLLPAASALEHAA